MAASAAAAIHARNRVARSFARDSAAVIWWLMPGSARSGLYHGPQIVEHLAALIAFLVGFLDPVLGDRLQHRPPFLQFGRCQRFDRLPGFLGVLAAVRVRRLPSLAK